MSRPFAFFGFAFLLALILSSFMGSTLSLVLAGVLLLCSLFVLMTKDKDKKKLLITAFLAVSAGLVVFTMNYELRVAPSENLIGETATIQGTVIDTPSVNGTKTIYKIKTNSVNKENSPQKIKITVSSESDIGAGINDTVSMSVKLADNSKYAEYASGFYLRGNSVAEVSVTKNEKLTIYGQVGKLRVKIKENIMEKLPTEEASVIVAMILGDKSELTDTLKNSFSESGVYHIFAVSGLHVSLWSMLIYSVLRKLKAKVPVACIASCGFVLFYMALTGFTMSVLRAGIMMLLLLSSRMIFRRTDTLNSLGFAVFVIGLFAPMATQSVSFLLTVFATTGVVTLGSFLSQKFSHSFDNMRLKSILNSVATCICISFAVTLFTLPVCAIFFKKIAIVSILANVIIIPIGTFTIVLGGLLGALSPVVFLGYPLALFAGLGAKLMIWLSKMFASVPFGSIGMEDIHWLLSIAGMLMLTALAIFVGKKKFPTKTFALSCALLLIVPYGMNSYLNKYALKIRLLDSFSGMTIVATYRGRSAVINTGGYKPSVGIANVLSMNSVNNVDLLIIPTFNDSSGTDLIPLAEMRQVSNVLVPKESIEISNAFEKVTVSENIALDLWDGISVRYKYNENGFWVGVKYEGVTTVCIDGKSMELEQLDEDYRNPDVVICADAPHSIIHGKWNIATGSVPSREISSVGKIVTTSGMGDLIIKIDKESEIDVRREQQWEQ